MSQPTTAEHTLLGTLFCINGNLCVQNPENGKMSYVDTVFDPYIGKPVRIHVTITVLEK